MIDAKNTPTPWYGEALLLLFLGGILLVLLCLSPWGPREFYQGEP